MISEFYEQMQFLDKTQVSNAVGGYNTVYRVGESFEAYMATTGSSAAQVATQTVPVSKTILMSEKLLPLELNDYIYHKGLAYKIITNVLETIKLETYQWQCELANIEVTL